MYRSTHSLILTLGLSFSIADLAGCGAGDASKGSASGAGGATTTSTGASGTQSGNGGTTSASTTGSGAGGATASSSASSTSGQPSSSSSSASSSSGSTSSGSSSGSSSASSSSGSVGKSPGTPQAGDITVDPTTTFQVVDGFGEADVWQGEPVSEAQQTLLFDPVNGIGLTLLRIGIESSSGTSVIMGNAAFSDGPAITKFGGKVWAAPWSPPAADKENNNVNGGVSNNYLSTSDYEAWATKLAAFPAYYKQQTGVDLYAISAQNEPDFNATHEACLYTASELVNFIDMLGPKRQGRPDSELVLDPGGGVHEPAGWEGGHRRGEQRWEPKGFLLRLGHGVAEHGHPVRDVRDRQADGGDAHHAVRSTVLGHPRRAGCHDLRRRAVTNHTRNNRGNRSLG
jgi:Glycosyl hydrolase family 30 TIM-barrel domain